jgi:hypothetical protein
MQGPATVGHMSQLYSALFHARSGLSVGTKMMITCCHCWFQDEQVHTVHMTTGKILNTRKERGNKINVLSLSPGK